MKLRVTMENEAGELDSAVVEGREVEKLAAEAMVNMIEAAGELQGGDVFRVTEVG